jgi:PiT family inorganic phosphate transporter
MTTATLVLVLVVVVALAFDFTNGFHDTGNAMATSIATGALRPKIAVGLAAILNLVGAFLSVEVALTVTNAVINIQDGNGAPQAALLADGGYALLLIILAGLVGGIVWNVLTWLLGLPSSSSHALFGGLIGSAIAALGMSGVKWTGDGTKLDGVIGKVILPAVASPVIAGVVAALGTWLIFRVVANVAEQFTNQGFRWGQIGSASLVSLAHGTNDAQKTMGVITLALIAAGQWTDTTAIAAGTYAGGWRVIRTLGKGLVEISPPQGMAAESASAAVILTSSHLGFALSTTHVATGSILGSGVGRPGATVRWGVARRMVAAWLITLPAAGLVGAVMWYVGHLLGGALGPIVVVLILAALSGYMWMRSRRQPVNAGNVNDEWDESATKELERVR